jgi:hypothetical protein
VSQLFSFSTFRRQALLGVLSVILLGAVILTVYGEMRPLERTFHGSVKDLLPKPEEVPGWTVEYLPIADTPEMQEKVNELLNYDDAVYAVYTKGAERISIYIAYWTPGKMSQRLIAAHTPDVCWVGAGWRITDIGKVGSSQSALDGDLLTAAPSIHVFSALRSQVSGFETDAGEQRLMERSNHIEQVAFWHLSGGEVVSYGIGAPKWRAALAEAVDAFGQRKEQLFVRVSSAAETLERRRQQPVPGMSLKGSMNSRRMSLLFTRGAQIVEQGQIS